MFGVGVIVPAAATADSQIVGIEQTVGDPDGTQIAYTVTKIVPSADPVAYPLAGQLYEATVVARAIGGTVDPMVSPFAARAASGANYPALTEVSSLSTAPLAADTATEGTVYFDVVGPVPTSIVYGNPPEGPLTWKEPIAGVPTSDGSSTGSSSGGTGGGSTIGGGGTHGVTGSTGPNDVSPTTSGGDIGGGEGGTEGGGGNLSSGGGSGAPTGSTGNNGSGSGG
jgi:hypothetical protein